MLIKKVTVQQQMYQTQLKIDQLDPHHSKSSLSNKTVRLRLNTKTHYRTTKKLGPSANNQLQSHQQHKTKCRKHSSNLKFKHKILKITKLISSR